MTEAGKSVILHKVNARKNRSSPEALRREPLAGEKGRARRDEYGSERHTEICGE